MLRPQVRGAALALVCLALILLTDAQLYGGSLTEGSACRMEDGSRGVCVELPKCPMRIEEVKAGKRFSTSTGRCSFKDFVEIVCCPLSAEKLTTTSPKPVVGDGRGNSGQIIGPDSNWSEKLGLRPADVACHEYENEIIGADGEKINPNIFNGERAQEGEFPYVVALGFNPDPNNPRKLKYQCGGTLISTRHVLTAAHCVNNINNLVPVEVRLGTVDLENNAEYVQRIPIEKIISHPSYRRSRNYYDIAILKLKRPVNVSKNVMPICLQTKPISNLQTLVNMSLVVTGWGVTNFENDGTANLQKTPSLQIVDRAECNEKYKGLLRVKYGIDESMICMLDRNVTRRADACQGDSGGPLLLLSSVSSTVLGVTSFGQSCGSSIPAVYTSVIAYLDWIEETVWPDKKHL